MAEVKSQCDGRCFLCYKVIATGQATEVWRDGQSVHGSCAMRRRYVERLESRKDVRDGYGTAEERMDFGLSEVNIPIMADYPHKPNSGETPCGS